MAATPLFFTFILLIFSQGVKGATFTFINKCDYTVWPGILASAGSDKLDSTGFELTRSTSRTFQAPTGWSGRFWGRTGCQFDESGRGSCSTGDCGSGEMECHGAGATPPATLAEFTLGSGSKDFYDVSLVDGYNLPMFVEVSGGSGDCGNTGCATDLNRKCPTELRVDGGGACKSACEAFGSPEYCCSGDFNNPAACKPSMYSEMFKSACPKSYSYAYDDATSTFTCTGADYAITFCPNFPSLKSATGDATTTDGAGGAIDVSGTGAVTGTNSEPIQAAALGTSWDAYLATATGDSTRTSYLPSSIHSTILMAISLVLPIFLL